MSKFPVSRVCPQCGSKEYNLRKPKELVAFAADMCSWRERPNQTRAFS